MLCAPISCLDTSESKSMLRVMQSPSCGPRRDGFQHITCLCADGSRHKDVIDDSRHVSLASLARVCGAHGLYCRKVKFVNPIAASMAGGVVPYTWLEVEVGSQDQRKTTISC